VTNSVHSSNEDPVTPGNLRFHAMALARRIRGMLADGLEEKDVAMLRRTESLLRRTAAHLEGVTNEPR
jgi:hypothetical protein